MFLDDNKILNLMLARNWFTNVKVIEITPDPRVSETGLFSSAVVYGSTGIKIELSVNTV